MLKPWLTAYVVVGAVLFGVALNYMLSHRQDWWGWVILASFAVAVEVGYLLLYRRSRDRHD